MKKFYTLTELKLSKKDYETRIQTLFCQNLNLLNEIQSKDLIKIFEVQIGCCSVEKFQLCFKFTPFCQTKLKFFFLSFFYFNQNKILQDETVLNFEFDLTQYFNLDHLFAILDHFLFEFHPNNLFTKNFRKSNLIIDENKIIFSLTDFNVCADFELLFQTIKNYCQFLFLNLKPEIEFQKNFDETVTLDLQLLSEPVNGKSKEKKLTKTKKTNLASKNSLATDYQLANSIDENNQSTFEVWSLNKKESGRTKKTWVVSITNYTEFYTCVLSAKLEKNEEKFALLKPGVWIKPKLFKDPDAKFKLPGDCYLTDFDLATCPPQFQRSDQSTLKINNLFVHTKYSALDGLFNFEDYAKLANQFNQRAIAITDLNSVQSFPHISAAAKKFGIKPIYGAEFEILNLPIQLVLNDHESKVPLNEATYCVFDIETTGLNALFDDITEIAVAKYQNGIRIAHYQQFVKTKKILKSHIIELTKITNELLDKEGVAIEDALMKFTEFVDGAILIAHNGINFDLPFLNAKLQQCQFKKINNPLIDTMQLSRRIFFEDRSHNLGVLARRLEIDYDEKLAHRADQDVAVLADIFFKLFPFFENLGISLKGLISQFNLKCQSRNLNQKNFTSAIAIYAKNQVGLKNLYELISKANTDYFFKGPTLTWDLIAPFRENLVIVSAPVNSELWEKILAADFDGFQTSVSNYDYVLIPPPSCYDHEINRGNLEKNEVEIALSLMYEHTLKNQKKPIANAVVKYLNPVNQKQYSVLVHTKGIKGVAHRLYSYQSSNAVLPKYHFRSSDDLLEEFNFLQLEADALNQFLFTNNAELVNTIDDNLIIIKKQLHPPKMDDVVKHFKSKTFKNFHKKYGTTPPKFLEERLEWELNAIIKNNFAVIYWVAHLLVEKSLSDGYLVGSRGSVGSSFVAYLINITEVNPLPAHYYCTKCLMVELFANFSDSGFDLPPKNCPKCQIPFCSDGQNIPFETFMGFDADKTPDIDLNFSGEYQPQAHNFLKNLFGEAACFRAGTISTVAEKTAFGFVKKYFELTDTAYTQGLLDWLIYQIIDVKRTTGQHPGGILVVPNDMSIYDFTPVSFPADDTTSSWKTTHLAYEFLHDSLLKFDVLGHDDPTILKMLKDLTQVDPRSIPNSDPAVIKMFSSCQALKLQPEEILGETTGAIGLPEFGTQFVRNILRDAKPQSFADLVRISGLSHGTNVWKNNAEKLIKKNHLTLKEVISCRDDIMVYLIANKVPNLDAFMVMESVRKGKKVPVNALEGLRANKIPEWYIESANLIEYLFPKAHAAAYVLMAWRVAYYKMYYPVEYYATYFSIRSDKFDVETLQLNNPHLIREKYLGIKSRLNSKNFLERNSVSAKEKDLLTIYEVALEMLCRGIKFQPTDLNHSDAINFLVDKKANEILIPFVSIDGLGNTKAVAIVEARKLGEFKSKDDLVSRTRISSTILKKLDNLGITSNLNRENQVSIFDMKL